MSTSSLAPADRLPSDRRVRDWLLFTLTVSSGAVDAFSFLALGGVFTAFMTGNLAFLGMGMAGPPHAASRLAVLASMASYGLGIYLATLIVTPRQTVADDDEESAGVVWPLRTTYALAVSLLPQLGFIGLWIATGGSPSLPSGRWRWGCRVLRFDGLTWAAYSPRPRRPPSSFFSAALRVAP